MLSKCVNPECFATFRYLHEGKVFKLERSDPRAETPEVQSRNFEYFWLCSECARDMTVAFHAGRVTVQAIHRKPPVSVLDSTTASRKLTQAVAGLG
jgi:hypothetical protein